MNSEIGIGRVKLADNTVIRLKILIIDAKESGFSPFGNINFDVKVIGGITVESLPENLRKIVADKPLAPSELPKDGWEIIDIVEQEPAIAEVIVNTSKGKFRIKVVAEAVMASRNIMYRSSHDEPSYSLLWVNKISWKATEG
jgi:hypothetical protein